MQVDDEKTSGEGQTSEGGNEGAQDKSDTQDATQSDEQGKTQEEFELPDGRKVDAATLAKEWKQNFYPEFTRRSQKLRELERQQKDVERSFNQGAATESATRDALKDVPPDIREAVIAIVQPEIQRQVSSVLSAERQRSEWDKAFEELAQKWDGSDGKPKFDPERDKDQILEAISQPDSRIFDPLIAWEKAHEAEIQDYLVKKALTKQKGQPLTEKTGAGGEPKKPSSKPAKTLAEASQRAMSRLMGGSSFE